MTIEEMFLQYGLAGFVVYIFYRLYSNELKGIREEMREGLNKIEERLKEIVEELRRR